MRRTFKAYVGGNTYEIPTTMAMLHAATEAAGICIHESLEDAGRDRLVQGLCFVGMREAGITEVEGKPLTFELVGALCDFAETYANHIAFMQAMAPDVPAPKASGKADSKNATAEAPAAS